MQKKKIFNDKIRRNNFKQTELCALLLKSISDPLVSCLTIQDSYTVLTTFAKNMCATTIKNSCIQSGRRKGVYRYFRLSRILLRESSAKNSIYGLQKSSW